MSPALRFDPEARFSCGSCARCCSHDVPLSADEVSALRAAHAARFFREEDAALEGAAEDPFVPVARGRGLHVIRRRADGTCGFLSSENRCRLHEVLGPRQKPLACRMFPYGLRPGTGSGAVLAASFRCPSVVRGDGERLADQAKDVSRLAREWERVHAQQPGRLELASGRELRPLAAEALRGALRSMLEDPEPQRALARIARHLGDLTRWRALRLSDERRSEYITLTSRHRGGPQAPPALRRRPGLVARLLFRGFLFAALALEQRRTTRAGLRQWLRIAGLLLHVHGLGPGVGGVRLGAARGVRVAGADEQVRALVRRFLRQAVETAGGGRQPLVGELARAAAQAQAALRVARMRAGLARRNEAGIGDVRGGFLETAGVEMLEGGVAGRLLVLFAGGADDAFDRLAAELS